MSGTAYVALSGLRARLDQLDRLASDIANSSTSGYKGEDSLTVASERTFQAALDAAVDVTAGPRRTDFRPGSVVPTGRDLDFAVQGSGFFVVDTPNGERYTRNGHFSRRPDGTLSTADGAIVQGEGGPITLPATGAVSVKPDGTVLCGKAAVGKLKVVEFDNPALLKREAERFRAPEGVAPRDPDTASLQNGVLEQSNVSVFDRMAHLAEVSRGFEALQRGMSLLMNDVDARAISELGRR